jgi:hypothetical protein
MISLRFRRLVEVRARATMAGVDAPTTPPVTSSRGQSRAARVRLSSYARAALRDGGAVGAAA